MKTTIIDRGSSFSFWFYSLFTIRFSLLSSFPENREEIREKVALLRKALIKMGICGIVYCEVMRMNSPLLDKSLDFATQIVLFYEQFYKTKKDTTIAKQLLRSATSIGANINEAVYGNSKADFISKLHIALKETGESLYWLSLLQRTNLIEYNFDELLLLAEEIKRMLIASLNTAKK